MKTKILHAVGFPLPLLICLCSACFAQSVSIISPKNGQVFSAPASISLKASADNNDPITKVEFYNGTTKLGEDLTSGNRFFENMEGATPFSTADDFDTGTWTYALQYVDDTVYAGSKSARFEIRKDQPLVANGIRSEVTIVKPVEPDEWYSFAVLFPSVGYEKDTQREAISQFFVSEGQSITLRTDDDIFYLLAGPTENEAVKRVISDSIVKDVWHEVKMHIIHSNGSTGRIELWYDGELVWDLPGDNMQIPPPGYPKWKIGLYKTSFGATVTRRVIYFDNVQVGDDPYSLTWNSVPAGNHTLTAKSIESGGAVTVSAPVNITVNGSLMRSDDDQQSKSLQIQDAESISDENFVMQVFNAYGKYIKSVDLTMSYDDIKDHDFSQYTNQKGLHIFRIMRSDGKIISRKIVLND
jgi:hypothetical protein